jgi:hypothetical protein
MKQYTLSPVASVTLGNVLKPFEVRNHVELNIPFTERVDGSPAKRHLPSSESEMKELPLLAWLALALMSFLSWNPTYAK